MSPQLSVRFAAGDGPTFAITTHRLRFMLPRSTVQEPITKITYETRRTYPRARMVCGPLNPLAGMRRGQCTFRILANDFQSRDRIVHKPVDLGRRR